jgi:DNA-binding LacI/PurR family transcriptional regulator
MRTLETLKVAVPGDVKMGGFDDVKYASLLSVALTTIHQPCSDIGAAAVMAMVERIQNPKLPPRDILLDFRLVVRESTGGTSRSGGVERPLMSVGSGEVN